MPGKTYRHGRARRSAPKPDRTRYLLRLFVSGLTPLSMQAVQSTRNVCEEHLKNRYELEVVDLNQQPALAREADIVAAPTLLKVFPLPRRKLVGDLSDKQRVLRGLALSRA